MASQMPVLSQVDLDQVAAVCHHPKPPSLCLRYLLFADDLANARTGDGRERRGHKGDAETVDRGSEDGSGMGFDGGIVTASCELCRILRCLICLLKPKG
jgi:hypothetical protein